MKGPVQTEYPFLEQGSDEWLAIRKGVGPTASKFATAMGFGFVSPAAYMKEKLGIKGKKPASEAMEFGLEWEDYVVELYRKALRPRDLLCARHGFRRYEHDVRIGGSPDRLVTDMETEETILLEIKTTTPSKLRDDIPCYHIAQMVGLMEIYGLKKGHYACWGHDPEDGLFISELTYDPRLWSDHYLPLLRTFCDYWEAGEIPPRTPNGQRQRLEQITRDLTKRVPISQ